jgi:flagellar motor switch protein FliG
MTDPRLKKMSQGEDTASELLRKLPKPDAQRILLAMANVDRVDSALIDALQGEFHSILSSFQSQGTDGAGIAGRILDKAFSPEESRKIKESLPRAIPPSFTLAEQTDTKALWLALKKELPQTLAVIMAHLSPKKSAEFAKLMPDTLRLDVLSCLAATKDVHPDALEDIDEVLTKAIESAKNQSVHTIGGPRRTAEILAQLPPEMRQSMLKKLEDQSPQIASEIKSGMFTFDDLTKIQPRDFEKIIARISPQDLETALRRCPDPISKLFFAAMSGRRAEQTRDNIAASKAVSVAKISEAQRKIAAAVVAMIESGEIFDPLDEVV